jgi:hypothetical protein
VQFEEYYKKYSEENDTYQLKKPKMVLQVSKNKEQRLRFGFVRHQNAKMDGVEVLEAVKKSNPKFHGDDFRSWRYGNGN